MFVRRHESVLRLERRVYLRVLYLKQYLILSLFIGLLLKTIDRLTDLDSSQFGGRGFLDWLYGSIPGLSRCPPCQISLMFFALGMREVAALIGVESEAESALVGADVIAHEIGIL